jgi:hypothetical protein
MIGTSHQHSPIRKQLRLMLDFFVGQEIVRKLNQIVSIRTWVERVCVSRRCQHFMISWIRRRRLLLLLTTDRCCSHRLRRKSLQTKRESIPFRCSRSPPGKPPQALQAARQAAAALLVYASFCAKSADRDGYAIPVLSPQHRQTKSASHHCGME